jgi:hypothetical protein
LFLEKLKYANRLVNRSRFVCGFLPSVSRFINSRMLSTEISPSSKSPNCFRNRPMTNE